MKVLCVHHQTFMGGAEYSFFDLAQYIKNQGHDVFVVLGTSGVLQGKLQDCGISVMVVAMPDQFGVKGFKARRQLLSRLRQLIYDEKIDCLYANTLRTGLMIHGLGKDLKTKVVCHLRDNYPRVLLGLKGRVWLAVANPQKNMHFIAISKHVQCQHASRWRAGVEIEHIAHGIDTSAFMPAKVKSANKTIGMVAHMASWKNHRHFLHMAVALRRVKPDFRFVIAGSVYNHKQAQYLKALQRQAAELGLGNVLTWAGEVSTMCEFYQGLSFLIMPSINEPFGRVVPEALLCACPVIAYKSGAWKQYGGVGSEAFIELLDESISDEQAGELLAQGLLAQIDRQAQQVEALKNKHDDLVAEFGAEKSAANILSLMLRSLC